MKILLSPSKTKEIQGTPTDSLFNEMVTERIVKHMQSLSMDEIGKALKIKDTMLEEVYHFFQHYESYKVGCAGSSYSGIAFKGFNYTGLSEGGRQFANDHVWIGSALYGLVTPHSPIKGYRLDLVDKVLAKEKSNLYEWWRESIDEAVSQVDWILNLASKEYAKLIHHRRVVTVEFLECRQGVWKQLSTSSKQMRGALAHYVCNHQIMELSQLPKELEGFTLDAIGTSTGDTCTVVYRKE